MARLARGGERGAAVQDALVVEHHERARAEARLQLEARLAQQGGEAPVGRVEGASPPARSASGAIERLL